MCAVLASMALSGAVGVEEILRHELGEVDEHVQTRFFFLSQVHIFGMECHAVDLSREKAGESPGSRRGR